MTLSKRDAELRTAGLRAIYRAVTVLDGARYLFSAGKAAMYDRPKTALRRVRSARAHLKDAEAALKAWADEGRE